MAERDRLTNDNPTTNTENMLNLAYAKDGKVYLRYGVDDVNLCDYVSEFATKKGCNYTSNEIMEGACMECECEVNLLYCLAVQAAELRERLKHYEDLKEQGRLIIPPCKVGDIVYALKGCFYLPHATQIKSTAILTCEIIAIKKTKRGNFLLLKPLIEETFNMRSASDWFSFLAVGKTVFLTKEEAEQALKEGV